MYDNITIYLLKNVDSYKIRSKNNKGPEFFEDLYTFIKGSKMLINSWFNE